MNIVVMTTGGTLDKIYFDAKSRYEVGHSVVPAILAQGRVTGAIDCVEVMRKDSLEMTDEDRQAIVDAVIRASSDRIVVTHGTDTMAITAHALNAVRDKTIVLTGALTPARFAETDATFNLGLALGAVQCLSTGVYIAMNGRVFLGNRVRKNVEMDRFEEVIDDNSTGA